MKYSISLMTFKYSSMKMSWKKWNFDLIKNYGHTTEYLALGNALMARVFLKVQVFTNLLSVLNLLCL